MSSGSPFLGNSLFTLDLLAAAPTAACGFALAGAAQNLVLGGGCTLYGNSPPLLLVSSANTAGFASVPLTLPDDSRLVGTNAFAQAFVLDPGGAFGGLALTGGLRLTLGY